MCFGGRQSKICDYMVARTELRRQAGNRGQFQLTEVEAKSLLAAGGIRVVETRLATSRSEAIACGKQLGFPLVLKVVSPDIVHKSDVGAVRLSINSAAHLGRAYTGIMAAVRERQPGARITGVAVQKMASPGIEVIIGMFRDPQFGPVLMFGLGGVWTEVLEDVSFRVVPVGRRDAREMVAEIRGYPMLQGRRGQEAANLEVLEQFLLDISRFIEKHREIREMDLNPVLLNRDEAVAVDARIVLERAPVPMKSG
ncbi:MAG: acetyl-CoA synthetase [Dehalococcoidia bacterium]|nr:acetyl-CoA synthetase [Dehalococcoidia bacterium]